VQRPSFHSPDSPRDRLAAFAFSLCLGSMPKIDARREQRPSLSRGPRVSKCRVRLVSAGGLAQAWLHWSGEAASRVRSHISPGPYRSFRELSLAGSVDPVIWCPPTFVGAPGSSASTAHCGFALYFSKLEDHGHGRAFPAIHVFSICTSSAFARSKTWMARNKSGQ